MWPEPPGPGRDRAPPPGAHRPAQHRRIPTSPSVCLPFPLRRPTPPPNILGTMGRARLSPPQSALALPPSVLLQAGWAGGWGQGSLAVSALWARPEAWPLCPFPLFAAANTPALPRTGVHSGPCPGQGCGWQQMPLLRARPLCAGSWPARKEAEAGPRPRLDCPAPGACLDPWVLLARGLGSHGAC